MKNSTLAVVGGSGSGKSTVAGILCRKFRNIGLVTRFYEPQSGSIFLDDVDIATLDPEWLRQNIGIY